MYTILTTCPPYGSQNVGDKLIEQRVKALIEREKGPQEFHTVFREQPLEEHLAQVNASRAVLMPAFPVRDTPMHPGTYRLVDDLDRIEPPLIPIGGNWNVYPGDAHSRRTLRYSEPTTTFLHHVAGQVEHVSCREYYLCELLARHGVTNTLMTGDPAWYDVASLGKPMARPRTIKQVAFSPPLSAYYADQAESVLRQLAHLFPHAQKHCVMHLADADTATDRLAENSAAMSPEVTAKNRRIRALARELGFEVVELAGQLERMSIYDAMDLHVGYECHAHLYFLSKRQPSLLIAEDARGVGFLYTFGVGGVEGFYRTQFEAAVQRKTYTSGYCTSLNEMSLAPPRLDVDQVIRQFLEEELASGFRRYIGVASFIDETYETAMRPFIRALP